MVISYRYVRQFSPFILLKTHSIQHSIFSSIARISHLYLLIVKCWSLGCVWCRQYNYSRQFYLDVAERTHPNRRGFQLYVDESALYISWIDKPCSMVKQRLNVAFVAPPLCLIVLRLSFSPIASLPKHPHVNGPHKLPSYRSPMILHNRHHIHLALQYGRIVCTGRCTKVTNNKIAQRTSIANRLGFVR